MRMITFHGLQEQKHQFSQFVWLIPRYHVVILEVESYMLLVCSNSSLMLLRSGVLRRKDSNTFQKHNHKYNRLYRLTSWISSGLDNRAAPIPPLTENDFGQPMLISTAATSLHLHPKHIDIYKHGKRKTTWTLEINCVQCQKSYT